MKITDKLRNTIYSFLLRQALLKCHWFGKLLVLHIHRTGMTSLRSSGSGCLRKAKCILSRCPTCEHALNVSGRIRSKRSKPPFQPMLWKSNGKWYHADYCRQTPIDSNRRSTQPQITKLKKTLKHYLIFTFLKRTPTKLEHYTADHRCTTSQIREAIDMQRVCYSWVYAVTRQQMSHVIGIFDLSNFPLEVGSSVFPYQNLKIIQNELLRLLLSWPSFTVAQYVQKPTLRKQTVLFYQLLPINQCIHTFNEICWQWLECFEGKFNQFIILHSALFSRHSLLIGPRSFVSGTVV